MTFPGSFRRKAPIRASWPLLAAAGLFALGPWSNERVAAEAPTTTPSVQSINLAEGWRFTKGDPAGAEGAEFDDSKWSTVRVPHDWAIAGPFNPRDDGWAGKLPWKEVGWYRREFTLDQPAGSQVFLDFDGVMAFPTVYVNGNLAGQWDYGYTSFRIDATPFVNPHGKNVVAVRVDTTHHMTRWYPGAGIYRKAVLELRGPVHLAHWGVVTTTPEVADDAATVAIDATIENHASQPATGVVKFTLLGPDGKDVAQTAEDVPLAIGDNHVLKTLNVAKPRRWDVDDPALYSLRTEVLVDGRAVDGETTPVGFRTFEFTADDGFHLNGRRVQIHGVNLHHDLGPLGAAFNTRAAQRQLEIMKEMGVNALRTSHNPPAPEVLDLCDRMGIVVWDECFDKWDGTADRWKGMPSHEEHGDRHLRSMVERDRNHPSIVVWSIGNEIQANPDGISRQRAQMMADLVRKYDRSRPIGIASCNPEHSLNKTFDGLDLVGWNYLGRYAMFREHYPQKPIVYSESASAVSTRGFYDPDLPKNKTDYSPGLFVDSYDLNSAAWSDIADGEFRLMDRDRFVAGEFVWTGFDYLGEPAPYARQARSSYFGIVDLVGIPKDRYYLYRSYWRPDAPLVHILPHWNWPDRIGQNVPVFVYTNGDSAELLLNGRSLGRRSKGRLPERASNLAVATSITASSVQNGNAPAHVADGEAWTRWCAANQETDQWLEADLGSRVPIRYVMLEFEQEAKNYGYEIQASDDGREWRNVITQPASDEPPWGGPSSAAFDVDEQARYVRVAFKELRRGAWASLREFGVYQEPVESPYYDSTYDYRLRWNEVAYQPGELKAVAYRDGKEIGAAVVRTAGAPAALRLTPDRTELCSSGEDLCYVLVEAIDAEGTLCPLADNAVRFDVAGDAEIAGVGNGSPTSLDSFQSDKVQLFFGKAMLILRAKPGTGGAIRVTAASDGLRTGSTELRSAPATSTARLQSAPQRLECRNLTRQSR